MSEVTGTSGIQEPVATPAAEPAAQATTPPAAEGPATITGNAGQAQQAAEPIQYDFKDAIPSDGDIEFSEEESTRFVEVIKDMGLSNEQASNIVKYGMEWAQGLIDSATEQTQAEYTSWADTTKRELGASYDTTVAKCGEAMRYLEQHGIPNIREVMNMNGIGNRVEMVRLVAMIGDFIGSDPGKLNAGGAAASVPSGKDNLYPATDWSKYV